MKRIIPLAIFSLVLGFGAATSRAQTSLVQNVNIILTGLRQNTNTSELRGTVIRNSNIIQALSGTNGSFSTQARLVAITPQGGDTEIFVRDRIDNQTVDTDVSGSFNLKTVQSLSSTNRSEERRV